MCPLSLRITVRRLYTMIKCKTCKELLKTEPMIYKDNKISGKWVAHFQDTHGIPHEIFLQVFRESYEKFSVGKPK